MYKVSGEFLVSHHTCLYFIYTRENYATVEIHLYRHHWRRVHQVCKYVCASLMYVKINIKLQLDNLKTRALLGNSKMVKQFINFTK